MQVLPGVELYGDARETPQNESTPFYPRSPYAVAKQYAYWILVNYREAYGMHVTNGILFNHESPRRGRTFVTRKITAAVAVIDKEIKEMKEMKETKEGYKEGQNGHNGHNAATSCLYLGNLDSKRDWGHAQDYVEGMWRMLQQDKPDDYVLATGETHTVREFVEKAFAYIGVTVKWTGPPGSVEEIGVDASDEARVLVRVDPQYFRPTEVDLLLGDASKAKEKLGWEATTKFDDLVKDMMRADIQLVKKGDFTS